MPLNGGQFEQLPMFVSAREVREQYQPGDAPMGSEHGELWDRKLAESKGAVKPRGPYSERYGHLHGSIAQEGVREPVWAGVAPSGAKTLWEGHHRIASQYESDPERLVPILYGQAKDKLIEGYKRRKAQREQAQPTRNLSSMARNLLADIQAGGISDSESEYPANPSPSERHRYYSDLGFFGKD